MVAIHSVKHSWNFSGSSMEKTLPKVSWDGMPLGRSSRFSNHSFLALPNISTSVHESAPLVTALRAMKMTFLSSWRLARWSLGSSRFSQ